VFDEFVAASTPPQAPTSGLAPVVITIDAAVLWFLLGVTVTVVAVVFVASVVMWRRQRAK
jgi:hypothetical protein